MTQSESSAAMAPITKETIEEFRRKTDDPVVRLAANATISSGIDKAALNHKRIVETPLSMSDRLDTWKVTAQKKSGRCWLFSAMNLLRSTTRVDLGVKDFEFSGNYLFFWDKFERANFFLSDIIATADEDLDGRLVQFMLREVLGDGGQWDMAVSLLEKYGAVPKEAMPETESSDNTAIMNTQLQTFLRRSALELRELVANGDTETAIQAVKEEMLAHVWRILVIALGEPPKSFDWQWIDDDGEFHRDGVLTPQEFLERHCSIDFSQYVCVVDDPRTEHKKGHALTVEHLGNVVDGREIRYINADIEVIKELAAKAIHKGEPVWFGSDVSKQKVRDAGLLVEGVLDYSGLFGVDLSTTKEQRVLAGDSAMNHAMLLTGVDLLDGTPRRWRVENSWGEEPGDKGFFTMDDDWFTENVFEVAIHIDALPDDLKAAVTEEPLVLPAWDPMGTLA